MFTVSNTSYSKIPQTFSYSFVLMIIIPYTMFKVDVLLISTDLAEAEGANTHKYKRKM